MSTANDTNQLIHNHVNMARRLARSMARRVPEHRREDLEGAALLGLTEAAQRFNPDRGEPFGAFAVHRVRGAILDELRRGDVLSRRARSSARRVNDAAADIRARYGREASNDEVARELGISSREVNDARLACSVRSVPLDNAEPMAEELHPVERIEKHRQKRMLIEAMAQLSSRERDIMRLYYEDGLKLKEIGDRLGVTESRICQLRSAAVRSLRRVVATQRVANDAPPPVHRHAG